ncbi:hypothetical protein Pcinc_032495 [Petrolisthes cinctipes]|uniref:PiggyBac transposable element-derived protein domain-containing protein n=1 Tax=Petrolisthes cinctipes TaxID=88211 RepID=A0AAE1EUA2_PETCI|nr:hypothetical protein Pcinc_032495 [Petrolisthes cinctipes]
MISHLQRQRENKENAQGKKGKKATAKKGTAKKGVAKKKKHRADTPLSSRSNSPDLPRLDYSPELGVAPLPHPEYSPELGESRSGQGRKKSSKHTSMKSPQKPPQHNTFTPGIDDNTFIDMKSFMDDDNKIEVEDEPLELEEWSGDDDVEEEEDEDDDDVEEEEEDDDDDVVEIEEDDDDDVVEVEEDDDDDVVEVEEDDDDDVVEVGSDGDPLQVDVDSTNMPREISNFSQIIMDRPPSFPVKSFHFFQAAINYIEEQPVPEGINTIEITQVPPGVDILTDEEDIDDDIIHDDYTDHTFLPQDVSGSIELHQYEENTDEASDSDQQQQQPQQHQQQQQPQPPPPKKLKTSDNNSVIWNRIHPTYHHLKYPTNGAAKRMDRLKLKLKGMSNIELFDLFITEELLERIGKETQLYASQNNNPNFRVTPDCLRNFLGILLYTGYHKLPSEHHYWSLDEDFDTPMIRNVMPRKRFMQMKRYLHFVNNKKASQNKTDKAFKLRPVLDYLNRKFKEFGIFSRELSIDKQVVKCYGKHGLKQFIRGKPICFGFKQWMLCCGNTGFCYQMNLYQGKDEMNTKDILEESLGSSVVVDMIQHLEIPSDHEIYVDDFFTSHKLLADMKHLGIRVTGTTRANRTTKCPLESDKDIKQKKYVVQVPVKIRRPVQNPNAARRRSVTLQYTLSHGQVSYSLCKMGFLSILGISEARVKMALVSMSSTGSPRGDQRGRHPPGVIVRREVINRVLQHIHSFPSVSSHYTRAKSPHMRYLEGHLNIKKMYRLYLLWMEEHYSDEMRVKLSFYHKKFRGLNLEFKPPMTDTCTRCDSFRLAIEKADPEAKAEFKESSKKHLDLARHGQHLMKGLGADINPRVRYVDVLQKYVTVRKPRQPYSFKDARQFAFRLNFCEGYQLAMDYGGPLGSVRLQKGNAGYRPSLFNLSKVTLPLKYPTVHTIDPCKIKHLEDFVDIMSVSQGTYLRYIIDQQKELSKDDTVEDEDEEDVDNDLDDHLDYDGADDSTLMTEERRVKRSLELAAVHPDHGHTSTAQGDSTVATEVTGVKRTLEYSNSQHEPAIIAPGESRSGQGRKKSSKHTSMKSPQKPPQHNSFTSGIDDKTCIDMKSFMDDDNEIEVKDEPLEMEKWSDDVKEEENEDDYDAVVKVGSDGDPLLVDVDSTNMPREISNFSQIIMDRPPSFPVKSFHFFQEAINYIEEQPVPEGINAIEITQVPPGVDILTDEEDIDDDIIHDDYTDHTFLPQVVSGSIELHQYEENTDEASDSDQQQQQPQQHQQQQQPQPPPPKKLKTSDNNSVIWNRIHPTYHHLKYPTNGAAKRMDRLKLKLKGMSNIELFDLFITEELLERIAKETQLYASQNNNPNFRVTPDCLRNFLGILLYTGYHKLPSEHHYWSLDEDFDTPMIRNVMPRKKFMQMKRYLHFVNNKKASQNKADKAFKLRPVLDYLNRKFKAFGIFSRELSIDKQVVKCYGKHGLKQFIRGKPICFGFKQWMLCCGNTGFCYQMNLYQGKDEMNTKDILEESLGSSVVVDMIQHLEIPSDHEIYVDDFFTSHKLLADMKHLGIRVTGTTRANRTTKCPLESDKDIKQKVRGEFDYRFDEKNEILFVKSHENNIVTIGSNHQSITPIGSAKQLCNKQKKMINITQPNLIVKYKKHMGGVEHLDCTKAQKTENENFTTPHCTKPNRTYNDRFT